MAQFLGSVRGGKGEATRLGSKQSGLVVNANGWNAGVKVVAEHVDGQDVFHVYRTGGSSHAGLPQRIATVKDEKR